MCRTLATAVLAVGLQYAVGIEFDLPKVMKAQWLLKQLSNMDDLRKEGGTVASRITVQLGDIMKMTALPALATHFYVFWEGFKILHKRAFGILFRNSVNAKVGRIPAAKEGDGSAGRRGGTGFFSRGGSGLAGESRGLRLSALGLYTSR